MIDGINIEALARQIAVRMDPDSLLDAEDVGSYLKCSPRYVLEEYTRVPTFPKAIRLTGPEGRKSYPRWRRKDITEWVASHAEAEPSIPKIRPGRARKDPYAKFQ